MEQQVPAEDHPSCLEVALLAHHDTQRVALGVSVKHGAYDLKSGFIQALLEEPVEPDRACIWSVGYRLEDIAVLLRQNIDQFRVEFERVSPIESRVVSQLLEGSDESTMDSFDLFTQHLRQ
ncbi:hypothetical protein Q664_02685 [Archangium violaceum Cb vi76]|uniref:Uncharacterized protein n=1 Tax=Archangium violaceum Cb vi76 TaxID=1406225 RepID=A0A084T162_9BACT|nr:hypothetical protein Q664_02685 [Archangium violaceum Cb vi76]